MKRIATIVVVLGLRCESMLAAAQTLKQVELYRGVAAIYGRFLGSGAGGSEVWPNQAAIKAVIEGFDE